MKILVLMPCNERMTYAAARIFKEMPIELKEITFMMPLFMDYYMEVNKDAQPIHALFNALLGAQSLYNAAGSKDLIIFGNVNKNMKFDVVFSFQDSEMSMEYEDKFIALVKEKVAEYEQLTKYINNLYTKEDVVFQLTNCVSTAGFLTDYIKTDPKLEEIKAKYEGKLNFKKVNKDESSI